MIGAVSAGDLGLLVADKLEHLGPANRELFEDAVVNSGLTVIAACVATAEDLQKFGPALRSEPAAALMLSGN